MKKQELMKFDPEADVGDKHVNMSNALARASHGLSLAEKRVIAMGLAMTDSVPAMTMIEAGRNGWSVKVTALDYAKTFDLDANTAYEQLKEAGDKLIHRHVTQIVETRRGPKEIKTNWCAQVIYHQGEGWVSIEFTRHIAPHLLALRSKFVTYKLKQAAALRSAYSWRLFECLQSWSDTGLWVVSIEDFAHAMDVPEKYRADFTDIRRRVIEPAVAELILKSGFIIEWKTKKAGRKVTGLTFRFTSDDIQQKEVKGKTKAMFERDVINGIKKSEIEAKARVGESYESAAARIAKEKQQAANQHGGAKIQADVSEKIAMLRGALK